MQIKEIQKCLKYPGLCKPDDLLKTANKLQYILDELNELNTITEFNVSSDFTTGYLISQINMLKWTANFLLEKENQ